MPAGGPGRLIALPLPPGEEFARRLAAAWADGDAVLPLDPAAAPAVTEGVLAAARPDAPVAPGTALCIATSGSTGAPKVVELSRAALDASADAAAARLEITAADCWLSCLPWHHIGGLQVLLRATRAGTGLVVQERFDVARVAADRDSTLVSLVPTQLARLLDAEVDLRRFRAILLGAAAAPASLLTRAAAAGARVVTTYGMTETCGGCVYDGRPLDGVQVRAGDDGRIHLRGPMLMSGYRLDPAATAAAVLADGWLRTHDLGSWDGERLVVQGRADDVVVTGGENVALDEVVAVLATHPAYVDVAATAVVDPQWGAAVVAVVVPDGAAAPTLAELRQWYAARGRRVAAPRAVVTVDAIPRLASGKPDRRALHRLAVQAMGGGSGRPPSRR